MSDGGALVLRDEQTWTDLGTYLQRARRVDPDGDARLVGHGDVLAAYVCPLHGAGLPTVLGLRTYALSLPWHDDVLTLIAGLTDRLVRPPADLTLPLPAVRSAGVAWAGVSPPRTGWEDVGTVAAETVRAGAVAGIEAVAAGTPDVAGSAAVAGLRAAVWGRAAAWSLGWSVPVPDAAAFAAEALGFLRGPGNLELSVRRCGPWSRLSSPSGHVLVRPAPLT